MTAVYLYCHFLRDIAPCQQLLPQDTIRNTSTFSSPLWSAHSPRSQSNNAFWSWGWTGSQKFQCAAKTQCRNSVIQQTSPNNISSNLAKDSRSANEHQLGVNNKGVGTFLLLLQFYYFSSFFKIFTSDSHDISHLTTNQVTCMQSIANVTKRTTLYAIFITEHRQTGSTSFAGDNNWINSVVL